MAKKQQQKIKTINVVNRMNSVAVDGNALTIQKNGQSELSFFQGVPNQGNKRGIIDASMVANIRMTFEQLEQLANLLTRAADEQKKRMKKD